MLIESEDLLMVERLPHSALQGKGNLELINTYRNILNNCKAVVRENDSRTLELVQRLAYAYRDDEQFEPCERLLQRRFLALKFLYGSASPITLDALRDAVNAYELHGDHDRAEDLLRRWLTIERPRLGGDHPKVLKAVSQLALLIDQQSRFEESGCLFRQVISGYRERLGPKHPAILNTCENLALSYRLQRQEI